MIGAVAWGTISDLLGRALPFKVTLFLTAVFGIGASFSPNFGILCGWMFLLGSAVGQVSIKPDVPYLRHTADMAVGPCRQTAPFSSRIYHAASNISSRYFRSSSPSARCCRPSSASHSCLEPAAGSMKAVISLAKRTTAGDGFCLH